MLAGGKGARFEFQPRVGIGMDAERSAVDAEVAAQAHAVDDEPGVLDGRIKRERAPVEAGAALQEPFRQRIPAARHGHRVRRRKRRIGNLLDALPLLEPERPAAVQAERDGREAKRNNKYRSNDVFHGAIISFHRTEDKSANSDRADSAATP